MNLGGLYGGGSNDYWLLAAKKGIESPYTSCILHSLLPYEDPKP